MVENGLINKAFQDNRPRDALQEVIELEDAVLLAMSRVNQTETLVQMASDLFHQVTPDSDLSSDQDMFGTKRDDLTTTGDTHKGAASSGAGVVNVEAAVEGVGARCGWECAKLPLRKGRGHICYRSYESPGHWCT
ncbi:uncharacterized protein LOC135093859 isoform X2 [Scylla paramamosain]|uniref:uncharacterized protein LOC135093859 isoform X2 n=1 Tax=Scylla paramamosain TaxID=85552 RepID=UPI0030839A4E